MSEKETEVIGVLGGRKVKAPLSDPAKIVADEIASTPGAKDSVTLNIQDLMALITQVVSASSEKNTRMLADALLESRKPYKDPAQEENDKMMREQMKLTRDRINAEIEASKEFCPHKQGSNALSEFQGQLGSFVTHILDTGETIGICTNCQKVIRSTNPDDRKYFMVKSANRTSSSGRRNFLDPMQAQLAGRPDGGRDLKKRIVEPQTA